MPTSVMQAFKDTVLHKIHGFKKRLNNYTHMLIFVGLGLFDAFDVSVKGREAVLKADKVYAEFYTSRLMGASTKDLEQFYGKKIHLLTRKDVEVDPSWLKEAEESDLVLLVGGDPMVSTTHLDLRLRAMELGIKTKVIHSSSIVTAVSGITGLQNYRFGRSTTIPFDYVVRGKRIVPQTPYQVLKENLQRNLHTMLFLDIQDERYMTVNQGVELLLEMEQNADDVVHGEGILQTALGVGIARAGSDDATVKADFLKNLKSYDFGGALHILVVPGRLHFMEAKGLQALAGAPLEIVQMADD